MATPNQMPKKPSPVRLQVIDGLLSTSPSSWQKKTLTRDEDGKEVVETSRVVRSTLRFPLAQNLSEESVERLAKRWL